MTLRAEAKVESIGPYKVLAPLGQGGMGVVFAAEHGTTGERVAVKTVRIPQERHLSTIRREIRALARIRHPGVVRILDEGVTEDGLPWYAMEHLHGTTLRRMRNPAGGPKHWTDAHFDRETSDTVDSSLPTTLPGPAVGRLDKDTLQVLLRLCQTLAFVHGEGLVHCDLKPENIFVRLDGNPILVDFGLMARFGGALVREQLHVDFFVGTAEYMAPEQWEGNPVDARADLYALGCMLYEVIEGRSPFGGTRKELSRKHLYAQPPAIENPNVSEGLRSITERLLEKRREDRPGRALEVANELALALGVQNAQPAVDGSTPAPRPHLFRPTMGSAAARVGELLDQGQTSSARLLVLCGPRGGGKTRVAVETARLARRRGYLVLGGLCEPRNRPLEPFVSVFEAAADLDDKVSIDLLEGHRPQMARFVPRVANTKHEQSPALVDVNSQRERMVEASLHALRVVSEDRKLLLVLDDLQWADELSLTVLRRIASLSGQAITIAACISEDGDDVLQSLSDTKGLRRHTVKPLAPQDVTRMAGEMLGLSLPKSFSGFLVEHAKGNPFFVGEYLHAALEGGLLNHDEHGHLHLSDTIPSLPKSVEGLVRIRLERLGESARSVAQAAAVLGRRCDPDHALAVAELDDGADALHDLFDGRVLEEAGDGLVQFVHDLSREVAYEMIPKELRRELHRRAAETITSSRNTTAAELAHHLDAAGERALALVQLDAAATESLEGGAYERARTHLQKALELSTEATETQLAVAPRDAIRWRRQLAETHLAAGDLEASAAAAEDALTRLELPAPTGGFGWSIRLVREILRQLAHRSLPLSWVTDTERSEELGEATRATGTLARVAFFRDRALEIVANTFWSINLAERSGRYEQAARNYAGLGWTFGMAGLSAAADSYFERAQSVGEEHGDLAGLIFACTTEGIYRTGAAQWRQAQQALASAEQWAEEAKDPQAIELTHTLQGHLLYFEGRFEEAVELHERVRASARSRGNGQHEAWSDWCMGRAQLARGEAEPAVTSLKRALPAVEALNDHISEQAVHGLLAGALTEQDKLQAADFHAGRAAELGKSRAQVFVVLHGHEGVVATRLAQFHKDKSTQNKAALLKAARRFVRAARAFPAMRPASLWAMARSHQALGASPEPALNKAYEIAIELDMHHAQEVSHRLRSDLSRGQHLDSGPPKDSS